MRRKKFSVTTVGLYAARRLIVDSCLVTCAYYKITSQNHVMWGSGVMNEHVTRRLEM